MRIQIRARTWATKQPNHRPAAPHHAKTSEWERAGHKKGGPGGLPPALFPPFLGRNGAPPPESAAPRGAAPRGTGKAPTTQRVRSTPPRPRPGTGGNPRRRVHPAPVPTRPPTRGSPVRRSPRALDSVNVQGPGALILKEKTASRAREISHALLGSCVFFWRGAPGVELNDGHAIVGVLPGAITGIVKEGNGCDPSILTAEDLIRLDLHLRVHGEPSF